jgi:gamma-glutamylcyclotransferase (GGCT)/AIG2-like uncharacterized protein YtfP
MAPDEFRKRCPSMQFVGPARVTDRRLAFARRSKRTGTGVADISPAPGLTVWGALYEVDEQDLVAIDQKEGAGWAYRREQIEVRVNDPDSGTERRQTAMTYVVGEREPAEVPPSREYLDELIRGAEQCELPDLYQTFLRSLRYDLENEGDGFRVGLRVKGTSNRKEARGTGLAKVHPDEAAHLKNKTYAAALYHGKAALVEVCRLSECEAGTCQLDQSVRHALGMPGRESYGSHVDLVPVSRRRKVFVRIWPRELTLQAWPSSWLDSEKKIVVLHPNVIRLLGLVEGEVVWLSAVVSNGNGHDVHTIERRVFPGSDTQVTRYGRKVEYPQVAEAYLDMDARRALNIPEDLEHGYPITVEPNVPRIFKSRLLVYGVTLFLGALALQNLLEKAGVKQVVTVWITVAAAILFTLALVIVDIRAKLHY